MDAVFKALADPSRRLLLDKLFERDGQSLGELVEHLEMTRYGVMKHLKVLEETGLVATRRVGRHKFHYLNPVPIRSLHDRWISKYAEPWVTALADLKTDLETDAMDKPMHVYQTYIHTTPERLWQAITRGEITRRYFHQTAVESTWQTGSPVIYRQPDGTVAVEGEVVAAEPPRRLQMTWSFRNGHDAEAIADPPSRVTWEIEPVDGVCKLTLVHDGFASETATYRSIREGWTPILASLKSLLETGEPLPLVGVCEPQPMEVGA